MTKEILELYVLQNDFMFTSILCVYNIKHNMKEQPLFKDANNRYLHILLWYILKNGIHKD